MLYTVLLLAAASFSATVAITVHPRIIPRQSTDVPAQCTATCDAVGTVSVEGCTVTECCTNAFEEAYFGCLSCVGQAFNATDYTQAQTDVDTLFEACLLRGFPLTKLTFPGQNPNRTIASTLLAQPTGSSESISLGAVPTSVVSQSTITALPGSATTTVTGPATASNTAPAGASASGTASASATNGAAYPARGGFGLAMVVAFATVVWEAL